LRKLDMETETQILFRHEREDTDAAEEFDPLELDRYSRIQQLSRSLMESVSDLLNLKEGIGSLARQSETLLRQQARVSTDLQEALMRTRMVPFSSVLSRLRRVVRQNAEQMGKSATLRVEGTEGEMDRSVLDRLIAPIEHMLRNSLAHGIETAAERAQVDKPEVGSIDLRFAREGNQVVLEVRDDGRGIDLAAVRRKAAETGLLSEADDPAVSDHDAMQLIFEPGFSTATAVTQISGRGVGMDVVTSEIKQLGGSLQIDSTAGKGTTISVRLPFTLAITQALLVKVGDRTYAVPYTAVEGVVRLGRDSLEQYLTGQKSGYVYAGNRYEILNLAHVLSGEPIQFDGQEKWFPTLLVKAGEHRAALQVDGLLGMREIVVKSVGPQLSTVSWIAGGTILADGDVALILDASTLVRLWAVQQSEGRSTLVTQPASDSLSAQQPATATTVMVVDDSLTVRKVTGRLLERRGMNVIAAKDGVDAVARLQETIPDVMLLDVEMPRMDGYELTRHIRNSERLRGVPIIMITSRTGQKHRRKAEELGVDRYLGKPYQESDLLATIDGLLTERMGG
jgi:chemosensory pili system protein ChpA (sensor histidine kinase/response regulator)